ncbi:hypothetical protein SEA_DOTI_7 [Microbacterium phage DoTi]|nr:hypothetical protein SEA_DOTI_7 [Microbacterium phage DoTi]
MNDDKIETTDELLESRRAVYGDRVDNMQRVAAIWSGLLGVTIHDWQVPLLMSAYKMFRTFQTPNYSDNSDDIDGWKKMFVEVMDANHGGIIQARTVEEYEFKRTAAQNIASEVQAGFHDDYDLNRKVRFPRPQTLEEIIEEQEHRAAEEEIKEGRRPPHLRLVAQPTAEDEHMEAWLRNRCGLPIGDGKLRCRLHLGHNESCAP